MNLIDPLHDHVVRRPGQPAVITPQGSLSWMQLDRLLWSCARQLHILGVRQADGVGMTLQHPLLHLVASLALTRLGAAQVALPASDSEAQRLAIHQRLGLRWVLCDTPQAATLPGSLLLDALQPADLSPAERAALRADDEALTWLILQSSGTTGAPKLAALTQGQALARARQPWMGCGPLDVLWSAPRLDFSAFKQRIVYALHSGAAVCLPLGLKMDPTMLNFLNQSRATLGTGTPSQLRAILALQPKARLLAHLRGFVVSTEPSSPALRQSFRARVCPHLHEAYGSNESFILSMATPALQLQVPESVGLPLPGVQLQVVDTEGRELPSGEVGQIRARGPGVVDGYLGDPQATARAFRDGWFYPGDLGRQTPAQGLVLMGRVDDMMIFDGINIYPAEIENVLLDHPAVQEAAAFPVQRPGMGQVPVAAVVLRAPATVDELLAHCRQRLGAKHPRALRIVGELPRNAMGKVLKRELARGPQAAH